MFMTFITFAFFLLSFFVHLPLSRGD